MIIGVCVLVTVGDAIRTTRRAGIHTAITNGGRLHALAAPVSGPVALAIGCPIATS